MATARANARYAKELATTAEDQAMGGARDWKGPRRDAIKSAAWTAKCTAGRDVNVSGRIVGAAGVKEVLRK